MLQTLIRNTRIRIASILALFWILYLIFNWSPSAFLMPLFSLMLVTGLDLLITYLRKKTIYLPASSCVTGLLIGLIISPNEPWYVFALACASAVFSKQFITKGMHKHIFNPAAFGIFTASIFFGSPIISWWAVSWHQWIGLLAVSTAYTLYKLKRLWLPTTFIISYGLFLFIVEGFALRSIFLTLTSGTLLLFTFVMLPEPITSTANGKWKYGFGLLVAAFATIAGRMGILTDLFLPSLLAANVVSFLVKKGQSK